MSDQQLSTSLQGTETILVIDDDEGIRYLVDQVLNRYGYRILTAEEGREGLRLFQNHTVDLVILDLSMPGLQGEEVLAAMKLCDPDVKVVLFTGFAPEPDALTAAQAIIYKPFPIESLVRTVREQLDA
ncbi:MAG: response regulator [Gemmatimonadetes bacterium]|jgi:DNA-binding NtrC family response regulator|nr:response regulator [Gemmatimonadota bacterium]